MIYKIQTSLQNMKYYNTQLKDYDTEMTYCFIVKVMPMLKYSCLDILKPKVTSSHHQKIELSLSYEYLIF